ncbi:SMP-30/gluconolactonase/LRE family protein [Tahibacter harae]|uniref:Sugar lactone lactonase YvrE n=1 Tax=Tahibacter harae TaxID=2963937 RepID=A0ABT1QQN7_9GAMM|nr:hypothetical protein [Tahibacter harae]MCQ4164615.1 hypothetical protein [Tahibacter harae]
MKTAFLPVLILAAAAAAAAAAESLPLRIAVERFIELPPDVRQPEGLAVDAASGDIFVGTYDARLPESVRNNQLLRYSRDGRLLAQRRFGTAPLTGLAVAGGHVYVLNFGASKLQRLPVDFDASTAVTDVATFGRLDPPQPTARTVANPEGSQDRIEFGASGFPGINGMVPDRAGNLYVSDSFQGAIYRIAKAAQCAPCDVQVVSRDPLLGTAGALPFGANGLALDEDEQHLYITNAGDGRLLRMKLPQGSVNVVAESIHGADGLLQHKGWFWVAANQADAVIALDAAGRVRARAGAFEGLDGGAPRGLLFPASTAVNGGWMVVTNLSLPITPMQGDEWEEDVTRWTLSRFKLPATPPE